jgi:type I restriction enzyme S subunit
MEVKSSHKQTDVGAIPEDWSVETIGELIEGQAILGHLDGNHGELYPRSHEFKPSGVPYIGANDFDEGDVSFEHCKFLSAERAAKFRKGVARDGDVLFAHNATVGPVALLRTNVPFVILSTTATYFRCNPEKLNNLYLKCALQGSHFVKQYQAVMAQSTRFQVPITAQRKLALVIPPLPEQGAIAAVMSDVDALLDGLDRLIAKQRDLKQSAMQQLLTGKTRLPGFSGEWERKRFGAVVSAEKGQLITSATLTPGSVPVIAGGKEPAYYHSQANRNGMTITISASGASAGYVAIHDGPIFASDCSTISERDHYDIYFMFFLLSMKQNEIYRAQTGGAQPHIHPRDIHQLEAFLPPSKDEQAAIATILSDMDAKLDALEHRRAKTAALKQGMMQELLTGRTRLV